MVVLVQSSGARSPSNVILLLNLMPLGLVLQHQFIVHYIIFCHCN